MGLESFLASATLRGSVIFVFSSARARFREARNAPVANKIAIVTDFVNLDK